MTGEQRAGQSLPASYVSRLGEQLRSCDQPLIQLWSWPWSGKRRLLEALAAREPAAWARLPPHGALIDRLSDSGPLWFVAEGPRRGSELLAAAAQLRPEQRLVLPVERRLDDEILPQRVLGPQTMLLRPAEVEEMFAGAGDARLGELARLSDGWAGPLSWLRDRWRQSESPEVALAAAEFTTRFHQRVTGRLDLGIFDAMIECSVAEELDASLWRRIWIGRPEKLAALERLLSEWGWVIREPGAAPRLPRLIRRATRSRRLPPERQREIYGQLGLAAYGHGRAAEAERYLRLAGDTVRLGRLRSASLADIETKLAIEAGLGAALAELPQVEVCEEGPSGDRGASVVDFQTADARPRFRLHLLGQAMIRRIDGDTERELEWRLRRALQSVAFLALAPDHRATKEQLVDAIWRDSSPTAIAKNFHPTLSEARRTLDRRDVFIYSQGLYSLNPAFDWWIDCDRFREQIDRGRRLSSGSASDVQSALDAWLGAWRLYRGELLSGVEAAWLRGHRAVLYREYTELLRSIGGLCARLGHLTQALDAYRSLLIEEPFEEQVHLAVMELYSRQGRRDLVRRQFVRMQELLIQELNVEPVEETRERYHQLMR